MVNDGIDLGTEITILNERANLFKEELNKFQVHPQYKDVEIEASIYAKEISNLSNRNFMDRQMIDDLKEAFKNEETASDINLKELYEEVKVKLPEVVIKTFQIQKYFMKN